MDSSRFVVLEDNPAIQMGKFWYMVFPHYEEMTPQGLLVTTHPTNTLTTKSEKKKDFT